MLRWFFTYEDKIPPDAGFALFGWQHLLWLAALAAAGLCIWRRLRALPRARALAATRRLAVCLVALEGLRLIVLRLMGALSVYELPLHLCALAGFLCLTDALTGWRWTGETLYALCLPGTFGALLFPNWTRYPAIHFCSVQSFLFHGGLALYILCRLGLGAIQPSPRRAWQPLLFLAVVTPPIYLFDKAFDANYFFVNGASPGSPLVWIEQRFGRTGYLAGFAVLMLLVLLLMYGIWARYSRRRRA